MAGTAHHHNHPHDHHHGAEPDWEAMGDRLELEAEVLSPYLDASLAWLVELTAGTPMSRILDVGSGPGVGTVALATAFPTAQVVAIDTSAPLLARARRRAERRGLGDRVHVEEGDLGAGTLATDEPADLVWAAMVVHHIGDQQGALATLRSLLRPGGRVALVEGDRTLHYLPADLAARLEPALHRAAQHRFDAMRAALPDAVEHDADWAELLAAAGFTDVTSRTFPVELAAPLSPGARSLVRQNLAGLATMAAEHLDAGDLALVDQLLDDHDPAGLALRDDLTLRATRTVYTGTA